MDCILFRQWKICAGSQIWDGAEAKRPLTPHGAEKAEQAARGLPCADVDPTHLLSSPYVRAFQTAERNFLMRCCGFPSPSSGATTSCRMRHRISCLIVWQKYPRTRVSSVWGTNHISARPPG